MKTFEYVIREFGNLMISDANHATNSENIEKVKQSVQTLIAKVDSLTTNDELSEILDNMLEIDFFDNDKQLPSLKSFETLNWFKKIENYNINNETILSIENQIKREPNNKLLPLIWCKLKYKYFENEETLDKEVADFFIVIFEKYLHLVELEDFFTINWLPFLITDNRKAKEDIFAPVFEKAVNKYPNKLILKTVLSGIYYMSEKYNKSSIQLESALHDYKYSQNSDTDFFNYIDAVLLLCKSYERMGEYEKALEQATYVIENLPIVGLVDGEHKDVFSYIDAFFVRMRINIFYKIHDKINADYQTIKSYLNWEFMFGEYDDVIKYIEQNMIG